MRENSASQHGAVTELCHAAVDYAGLFPPAKLPLPTAVRNYVSYQQGAHSSALGRFVLPVAGLADFEGAHAGLPPAWKSDWRLSVLAGPDLSADWRTITAFQDRNPNARVVALEYKPDRSAGLRGLWDIPPQIEAWVEVPASGPLAPLLEATANARRGAKIRTGGVTPDAFPDAARVVEFLAACLSHGLVAKATAGLHHPLTGTYALTYEPEAPRARMFGFVNLILAAAHLQHAGNARSAIDLLEDSNVGNFRPEADRLHWKDTTFPLEQIRRTRHTLVRSFGSCSFLEPIEGLQSLGWL